MQQRQRVLGRFLTFYTLALIAGYSLIRYKTPWCMLSFLHGLILMAGIGAVALLRWARPVPVKVLVSLLLLAGAAQLGYQAYRFNYRYYADSRFNPLVYGHPSLKMMELVDHIRQVATASPDGKHTFIRVITRDCWPLPWYLRDFDRIAYYPAIEKDNIDAPIVITSMDLEDQVNAALTQKYSDVEYFGLRVGVPLAIHVQSDLWQAYLKSRGLK